jgi:hypothetical protein
MAGENNSTNPFSNIPLSPTVEVRTLHGDVQSMSATGGTSMQVEDVQEMIGRKVVVARPPRAGGSLLFNIAVLVLTVLIAALVVGFIVNAGLMPTIPFLKNFFSGASLTPTSSPSAYVPSTSTANFDPYADIEPQRFFRIPANATISLVLSREAAQTTQDLLSFPQRLSESLKAVPSSVRFVEVELSKSGGKPADGLTFMSLTGIRLFSDEFFSENFAPNFTAFIYRDSRGNWPGYIFRLLPSKNVRLVSAQMQFIERWPGVTALFLESPGVSAGPFKDGVRVGLPTREQAYSMPGAAIGYSWEDRYFVISTSVGGLEEALRRLLG